MKRQYFISFYQDSRSGKRTVRNMIIEQTMYNGVYYIQYSCCPEDLIQKYDKPILRYHYKNSIKVKQINPISGSFVIFNSYQEITKKLGITTKSIANAAKNKTLYQGSLWEIVDST